jgi:predicted glycoside hydrolase/deacetylase ChbG (UPF0249 family)
LVRQVIINADDFGLSPAVNKGIVEAYRAGGITSTSLMVNMPGFGDAVRYAKSLRGLGIGLHFNLTYGRPVSDPADVPSLVKSDGSFHDGKRPRARDAADVAKELNAQWRRFASTGLRPAHLDSHHLLHQNDPVIFKVMAEKAVRENVPLRRSQTNHLLPIAPLPSMTDAILLDTYGDGEGKQRLLGYLTGLPEGTTEIVCHPGRVDRVLQGISEWTDVRERELSVFADPEIARTMRELGIVPVNYRVMRDRPALADIPLPARSASKAQPALRSRAPKRHFASGPARKRPSPKRGSRSRPPGTRDRKRMR